MYDPNILDINSQLFMEIETMLENKSTRDSLLRIIPPDIFDPRSIQLMDNESYKYYMTTGKWLLFCLGNKGVRISEFVHYLEEAKLEKALLLFKKDVPIKIIEQPPAIIYVQRGAKFSVSCKATCFPSPEYQWFKGDDELLLQQDKELMIDCIKEEDSGFYICLVSKSNLDPNSGRVSYAYSNPVEVVVLKDSSQNSHLQENFIATTKLISDSILTEESLRSVSDNLQQLPVSELEKRMSDSIFSKCKVSSPGGMIPQGDMTITLHCKARYINSDSKIPIKYQWYKNGSPIDGATYPDLPLHNLYPDPVTGDTKWSYCCMAFNDHNHRLSNNVEVELQNETEKTTFYASEKCAFMVANDTYDHLEWLKKPAKDVKDLGQLLEQMGFKVDAYRNLNLAQMKNAFKKFCSNLKPGCYVLFYFAGHGFEQLGQMYLQPVDCSKKYEPRKAICTEEILCCLQAANPAVNVLLIDACRNLPAHLNEKLTLSAEEANSFEIFKGKMKSNTIYGYSTPFLYSAHECDSECNSFFAKYLIKYINYDKSIFEVLHLVQKDLKVDKLVKGIQCVEIRSTLAGNHKLCDEIRRNSDNSPDLVCSLKRFREDLSTPIKFPIYDFSTITIKASPHLGIFMNDIDILVSIFINSNAPLGVLNELEIDLVSNMQEIQILPASSVYLKDIDKKINDDTFLLKKQVLGIQNIQGPTLECKLLIKFPRLKKQQEGNVSINVKNITDLKLSENYLGSLITESNSS